MDSVVLVLATMSILLIVASTCVGILPDVLLKGDLVKQPDKLCIYIPNHVYSTMELSVDYETITCINK